jgi:hypothetical protein
MVICINLCQEFPPSISVASYKCLGICCKPAKNITMALPVTHKLTIINVCKMVLSDDNQVDCGNQTKFNNLLIIPKLGCNSQTQIEHPAASGIRTGRKNIPLKKDLNFMFILSKTATKNENMILSGTLPRTYNNVAFTDGQK